MVMSKAEVVINTIRWTQLIDPLMVDVDEPAQWKPIVEPTKEPNKLNWRARTTLCPLRLRSPDWRDWCRPGYSQQNSAERVRVWVCVCAWAAAQDLIANVKVLGWKCSQHNKREKRGQPPHPSCKFHHGVAAARPSGQRARLAPYDTTHERARRAHPSTTTCMHRRKRMCQWAEHSWPRFSLFLSPFFLPPLCVSVAQIPPSAHMHNTFFQLEVSSTILSETKDSTHEAVVGCFTPKSSCRARRHRLPTNLWWGVRICTQIILHQSSSFPAQSRLDVVNISSFASSWFIRLKDVQGPEATIPKTVTSAGQRMAINLSCCCSRHNTFLGEINVCGVTRAR